jgi:hypothetical protein
VVTLSSSAQLALQPSPLTVLPSSQASSASTMPSPHIDVPFGRQETVSATALTSANTRPLLPTIDI